MFGGGRIALAYRSNPLLGYRVEYMGSDKMVWCESVYRFLDTVPPYYPILSYEDTWCEPTYEMLYEEG